MLKTSEQEDKINFPQQTLFLCIGLAAILFLAEELGALVGLSGLGLKISPIWPAAGIALAALLLLGWKVWPGIFVGFLAYNCLHLALSHSNSLQGILMGIGVSVGSLAQAFLGAFLIRRFSNIAFYRSLRETLLFLVIVVLTCLIAPFISILILNAFGDIPQESVIFNMLTFWAGDAIGVLLITPLIISFSLLPPITFNLKSIAEAFFLFVPLGLASFAIFFGTYPIHNWLFPFLLWAIFRFNIRGLTAALVLASTVAISATALGYGPYYSLNTNQFLFYLATSIGIIIATMLILTAIFNENSQITKLLQDCNSNLENTVCTRTHQLQEAQDEIVAREKLTSLAVLAAGITHEIKNPLSNIHELTMTAQDCTKNIQEACETHKNVIPPEISDFVHMNYNTLKECLVKIEDYNKQAQEVVNIILHRSRRETEHETGFKTVNIHNILNGCCNKAVREFELKTPYALQVIKNFDSSIGPIEVITLDLSRAFTNIIDNSVYALKQRTAQHLEFFEPTLSIQTTNREHNIEICIEDNGLGMSEGVLKRLFQPFFSTKPLGEGTGLGLALTHDIIVQGHHGSIIVSSEKDKFTKFVVSLPKTHVTDIWSSE